ncbi:putative uncharacterized protein DDB_G0282133 [Adelges cooleyi]|uniref:putative uncharacterized protein DDB_G0282133 n=1 Tax=Adelges cooleyi TaxID=133065 RepID=UPI0021802CB6|nr:putative uncharacterized protein DDB_G0282133 [Adelges cooleyi]XP_050438740.1 putative uncharacterized protein DDB_G0282133 [Adelges cooleyi]
MGGKKEPSKNRLYEKERRDRLNVSFEELRTVLPASETNASLGKAEIINHAVDFIRILQSEKLQISNINRINRKEIIRLKNRIVQLCNKIKYLLSLLKESKIEVPKEKSNKRSLLKTPNKSKPIKDSTIKNRCIQKLKRKSKLLPKPVSILLQSKPLNLPVLATSNKPTFIVPKGHLIKIETTPIIPQSQIVYDVPKLLLLPEYKSSGRLIVPKKNDATSTTSVNKRPIPSLATYNSLLKKTNFLNGTNKTTNLNDANLKKKSEPIKESTKKKNLDNENISKNNTAEADKHNSLETVKISDNKCIRSHTIEAIVKDINQEKNEKQTEREENISIDNVNSSSTENEIKFNNTENVNSNKLSNDHPPDCLSSTPTTSAVVNSLSILTEENQRKSMETAKNIMSCFDDIRLPMPNTDFSTDLFSSLQGPVGGHHADSMSPTEAFLLSFPLVSTSKNTSILNETEHNDIHSATPTTILQIGNLESPATELYQKNIEDCEKGQNKNKTKDSYGYNEKPFYNENFLDMSKKNDDIFGYNKEVKKSKPTTTSQPSIATYPKTHFNDIASYYKTTQSSSDLWRYTSYNSYDKNVSKNIKKNDKSTSTAFTNNVPYVPYDINPTTYIDTENYNEVWPHKPKQKKKQNDKNVLVNWMTDKGCQNLYPKKNDDSYQKKNNFDMTFDIQPEPKQTYSWSPSKTLPLLPHLDTNMPSTLPTLVGDLALNINTGTNTPFDQRLYDCNKKNDNVIPITSNEQNMFNYINSKSRSVNSNFLSVSQLVEQPKTNDKRKGKSCAKDYCCVYQNQKTDKDYYQNQTKHYYPDSNTFEQDQSWVRSKYSHDSSRSTNHSAESLIRNHQKNNSNLKLNPKNQHILSNKQTTYYKAGQKPSYSNNENISNYYNQHNSNYLYDCRNDLDKQPSTYQIAPNFYNPPVTTKHNIANYIPLPTTFNMTNSTYNKPIQHFTQNTNNYYNNSNNVNTLTNFNLSTIFPEINDKESNNITSLEGSSKNNEFDAINNYGTAIHPTF